ncbi:putative naringenin-chalcone synthase [Rubrobacter radiotolerans]|uniref:3-oxoacyl-[acyl-carrier-protein] synthase III C-terminal domain-containing protein n=1 Tax=Rubrobacter radiotolerans TaxID=42256 RepID=A0A023X2E6_RUBRA|nr:3-oxoacyl-[acyl-carrier-protein] synthase III C-terminal domain-containing protein [Rubrobacter radiotolerans]AHY46234.1 putative naringenin-chalcone synthase [Rubrobacter radiotolerans]MDX5893642.1 3-oxoacyl-[acyl-carrier-protein] synthase III C-terminal domain-containing protein [Rubrobacter radiotolerans]SMC04174.1 alkylresorcinol/alkylpyrone synthase [Rubrobacter radiotolerans DSM 5868]
MSEARILSVGTALPPHRIGQGEVKSFARSLFGRTHRDIERLMPLFDNVHVEGRNFCVPIEWFDERHTFPERNDLYIEHALALSEKAARRAMSLADTEPEDVGAVLFVSTTGFATPSLDSKLLFALGLSENTRRVPVWGLGCAGGASGLALAADHARLRPEKAVLLVAVELSGLTFQRDDASKANLISTSLFADGAAAVVVGCNDGEGPSILGSRSTTWPGTEDVMGWELIETGLKVELSRDVPKIVHERFLKDLSEACASVGLEAEDLKHFVLHPGGAKVLAAFEETLGLPEGALVHSRSVLRDHGNMSAPTVLFILKRFLERGEHRPGDVGVLSAMGPGFSCEHVFFRCT